MVKYLAAFGRHQKWSYWIEHNLKKNANELFARDNAGQFLTKIPSRKRSTGVIWSKETSSCMKLLTTKSSFLENTHCCSVILYFFFVCFFSRRSQMSSGAIIFKRRLGCLQLISLELSNLHQNKLDGQTWKRVRGKICTFDLGGLNFPYKQATVCHYCIFHCVTVVGSVSAK